MGDSGPSSPVPLGRRIDRRTRRRPVAQAAGERRARRSSSERGSCTDSEVLGFVRSTVPARVCHSRARLPLRCAARSGVRWPCSAPITSQTSTSINRATDHRSGSLNTSACSSSSTFLTTSSTAILSAPAIAGGSLSSNREKSDEHEHRGGRNCIRSVRPAPTPNLGARPSRADGRSQFVLTERPKHRFGDACSHSRREERTAGARDDRRGVRVAWSPASAGALASPVGDTRASSPPCRARRRARARLTLGSRTAWLPLAARDRRTRAQRLASEIRLSYRGGSWTGLGESPCTG